MAWYNPLSWFDEESEANAKAAGEDLYTTPVTDTGPDGKPMATDISAPGYTNTGVAPDYWTKNPGTTYAQSGWTMKRHPESNPFDFANGGHDPRNYMYGRTPDGADVAANRAIATGDEAAAYGSDVSDRGWSAAQQYANRGIKQGDWRAQDSALDTAGGYAAELAALERDAGPSAAQATLQAGTNAALAGQVALARSGRGFGGGAAATGLAQGNLASIQASNANQAAVLAANEEAARRTRAAGNFATAAGVAQQTAGQLGQQQGADLGAFYQGQGQNDQTGLAYAGLGTDAYFKGTGADLAGQGVASDIYGQQLNAGLQSEDNYLRYWAAKNGYKLAQDQADSQESSANTNAAATFGAALLSDVRSKTDIVPSDEAGSDFARGLAFDGEIYRPSGFGGGPTSNPEGFRSATARPDYADQALTPMQQEYMPDNTALTAGVVPRGGPSPEKLDALDASHAASLDAARNAGGSFFKYKDPGAPGADGGEHYGPMAQDLAKTPAGATAVVKQPNGKLGIDTGRLSLVNTSAVSAQQKQLDDLQAKLDALLGKQENDNGDVNASYYGGRAR